MPSVKENTGKAYWRSLREVENSPEFTEMLNREFPEAASEFPDGISRRRWMKLMGSSLAFAGIAGCRWEKTNIAPFEARPEGRIPGVPEFYATSIIAGGEPAHLLVSCYDGRPLKVEGNPEHPSCLGSSSQYAQATILNLYDPDRSEFPYQREGRQSFAREWEDFERFVKDFRRTSKRDRGKGFAVLLPEISSITLTAMMSRLKAEYPELATYQYSALQARREKKSLSDFYGTSVTAKYNVSAARIIACFDADLLQKFPSHLQHVRGYTERRDPNGEMNRLYIAESQLSLTGGMADHRLPYQSCKISNLLLRLEEILIGVDHPEKIKLDEKASRFVGAIAKDLEQNRGNSMVVVGDCQPEAAHIIAHRINRFLGNVGKTVILRKAKEATDIDSIESLVVDIERGQVKTLLMLGGNPVYDAPGSLRFKEALEQVECSIHLSQYLDETSLSATWHVPEAHPFECWGDLLSLDGEVCVTQPLISPLLNGRSMTEVLSLFVDDQRTPLQRVRESVAEAIPEARSDDGWLQLVHDGFSKQSVNAQVELMEPSMTEEEQNSLRESLRLPKDEPRELVFTASDTLYDGQFANNGWLQETPHSMTKITWDNAAILGPKTAEDLGLDHGDWVVIERNGAKVEIPVFILPGQARGSIGIAVGYGRLAAGNVGGDIEEGVDPVGKDVFPLISRVGESFVNDFTIEKVRAGESYEFATTQEHHAIDTAGMKEREDRIGILVREATIDEYKENPDIFKDDFPFPIKSLWEEPSYDNEAWGMSVDLNKCMGCNACVVACQAENNVPIVGRDQVRKGREMHWLRIDRYFSGDPEDPGVATQPVSCHHCENAPCEQVCPVAATVHSDEGLNDMVYNRCIGTRYCANNCPYKVRRFNFFNYHEKLEEPNRQLAELVMNPEVTVRSRGVMEKCTYCVQRIQSAKIEAGNEGRPIRDGDIKTACQSACAANAIEFGDLNARSKVAKAQADPRSYAMLAELNVKPRTTYMGRLRNPNLDLVESDVTPSHGT